MHMSLHNKIYFEIQYFCFSDLTLYRIQRKYFVSLCLKHDVNCSFFHTIKEKKRQKIIWKRCLVYILSSITFQYHSIFNVKIK